MTDLPAIHRALSALSDDTALDLAPEQIDVAWIEYGQAKASAHMEQVYEHNANRWMAAAEDWQAEAWDCYVASGADYSGRDRNHLKFGEARRAVKQLREDYAEACTEANDFRLQAQALAAQVDAPPGPETP